MLTAITITFTGALWNRIRGSGVPYGRTANDLAFGLLGGLAAHSVTTGALCTLGMALGRAPGWGRYIGAQGGWETQTLEEFAPVDWLIKPLRRWPQVWGAAGLALRGAFWGAMLGVAVGSFYPVLIGFTMPLHYANALLAARLFKLDNPEGASWEHGEFTFGAWLWLGAILCLGLKL